MYSIPATDELTHHGLSHNKWSSIHSVNFSGRKLNFITSVDANAASRVTETHLSVSADCCHCLVQPILLCSLYMNRQLNTIPATVGSTRQAAQEELNLTILSCSNTWNWFQKWDIKDVFSLGSLKLLHIALLIQQWNKDEWTLNSDEA